MKIKETKICNKKNKNKTKEKKRVEKNIGCSRGRVMTFDMYIFLYMCILFIVLAAYFFKICFCYLEKNIK